MSVSTRFDAKQSHSSQFATSCYCLNHILSLGLFCVHMERYCPLYTQAVTSRPTRYQLNCTVPTSVALPVNPILERCRENRRVVDAAAGDDAFKTA